MTTGLLVSASKLSLSTLFLACLTNASTTPVPPHPSLYVSENRAYGVKLLPQKGRVLGEQRATAILFRLKENGLERVLWQQRLVNLPRSAIVCGFADPDDEPVGIITLNNYGFTDRQHALVVYGARGKLLRDYNLEDILSKDELSRYAASYQQPRIWWDEGIVVTTDDHTITLKLHWGKKVRINAKSGDLMSQHN